MLTNIHDIKHLYDKAAIDRWFAKQYNLESELTREAYSNKAWTWPIIVDEIEDNFALDIYTHYTIVDGRKWKFVCSADISEIFYQEELKPVTKEEVKSIISSSTNHVELLWSCKMKSIWYINMW